MTNADITAEALRTLGDGWHTSREVMLEVRRAGYQMTTAWARGICNDLCRQGRAQVLKDGPRYLFRLS